MSDQPTCPQCGKLRATGVMGTVVPLCQCDWNKPALEKLQEPSAVIANKFLQDENTKLREELAATKARIAELERNLSELTARFNAEVCGASLMGEPVIPATHFETAEWSHLERQVALAQAEEQGMKKAVPEGWQVVPKEPTEAMFYAGKDAYSFLDVWSAMLAAAPKSEEKE